MSEITVTSENFETEVLQSDRPVLIDFWAPWCGPCRMFAPLIAELAEEHPEIKVCKVNVDDEMELASKYKVVSIPTVVAFKDGQVIDTAIGIKQKDYLINMVSGK